MKQLIVITLILTLASCSKNDEQTITFLDCEEETKNFKEYNGEEIGCKLFYNLTEYKNQSYLELNAHCADLIRPVVINESCVDICENSPYDFNSKCASYLRNRKIIKVMLIEN